MMIVLGRVDFWIKNVFFSLMLELAGKMEKESLSSIFTGFFLVYGGASLTIVDHALLKLCFF